MMPHSFTQVDYSNHHLLIHCSRTKLVSIIFSHTSDIPFKTPCNPEMNKQSRKWMDGLQNSSQYPHILLCSRCFLGGSADKCTAADWVERQGKKHQKKHKALSNKIEPNRNVRCSFCGSSYQVTFTVPLRNEQKFIWTISVVIRCWLVL